MRGFLNLIRSVFLSPELLFAALLTVGWWVFPRPFVWADKAIEKLQWIPLLGAFGAMIAFAAGMCWKILFPAKNAVALCQWPRYPELRTTTIAGLVFVVIGALAGVAGVIGRGNLCEGLASLLLTGGYAIAGIATLTMLVAALTIRSITSGGQ